MRTENCGKNRGQTGEFPFFRSRISFIGKKGIHQSDPDFSPIWRNSRLVLLSLRGFFLFARRKREIERCAFVRFGFGPNATFVAIDDALDSSEPASSTLELIGGMQTLKSTEELLRMLHVETNPIVAHEVDVFPGAGKMTDFDRSRGL